MPDYYIRTPENAESRGPFNIPKLLTLAEAGQITENTLYFDEDKEEWVPIALNGELKDQVFPEKKKIELKVDVNAGEQAEGVGGDDEVTDINVEDMLAAAEADTPETRHLKQAKKSLNQAAAIASTGLGVVALASAIGLIVPHIKIIAGMMSEENLGGVLNHPFLMLGMFDLLIAVFLFLSVTDIYPVARARAAFGVGFGVYVGWSMGVPLLMIAWGLGSFGLFLGTISQRFSLMLLSIVMGVVGHGYICYLALLGEFAEFYENAAMTIVGG
ncbi:MAG: GYF domain-containing protein [Coraliomargarita sp.]